MRKPLVVIAAVIAVLAAAPPPAVSAAPPPGWEPVFTSEFSGSAIPRECVLYDGPHNSDNGVSAYSHDETKVSGGMLRLGVSKTPYLGRKYRSGGIGCFHNQAQRYGRYQFRAKATATKGVIAYAGLWPVDSSSGDDMVHVEFISEPGNENLFVTNSYGDTYVQEVVSGQFADGFHTYTLELTPNRFRVQINGTTVYSAPHTSTAEKWLGVATFAGSGQNGPNSTTVLPSEFLIDWFKVWSFDAATYVEEPEPKAPAPKRVKKPQRDAPVPPAPPTTAPSGSIIDGRSLPSVPTDQPPTMDHRAMAEQMPPEEPESNRGLAVVAIALAAVIAILLVAFLVRRGGRWRPLHRA